MRLKSTVEACSHHALNSRPVKVSALMLPLLPVDGSRQCECFAKRGRSATVTLFVLYVGDDSRRRASFLRTHYLRHTAVCIDAPPLLGQGRPIARHLDSGCGVNKMNYPALHSKLNFIKKL